MLRQPHHKYTAITRWRKTRLITISLFVVILSILSLSISGTASAQGQSLSDQFPFSSDTLNGETVSNPTSLQFGPDNRLYISQQNAVIYAYTIERDNAAPGFGEYTVSSVETINLIKFNTPNHNDDGTPNGTTNRQVTGILVAGTATNPVLYVTSSDWRIAVGDDVGLDTNSGVLTRLTWNGSSWDKVDLVRGLARSEENHSTNGMALDESTNTLYVMSGGHANKGAPGNNLSGTPEYWTSAAMLSVDLDALNAMPVYTDSRTNTQFVYDLPNLDDPTRTNILGSANGYPSNHPLYNEMVDPGDPFGGNNGLNQAITIPDGPVQIYSPGYRNGYDVVFTEAERLYTWDNGPNGGWGGLPVLRDSGDNLVNYTTEATYETAYQPGSGVYCTNEFNENVSNGHGDPLAFVTGPGYYGGHPTPIRAFPGLAGVIAYMEQGNGNWVQVGPTYDFEDLLPDYVTNASGYSFSSWFPNNPVECTYTSNDSDRYLAIVNASTNGLTEYTASNFDGGMQGDLLAASFNDNIYLVQLDENGDADPADFSSTGSALFSGLPNNPLDVTAQGDDDIFPGTIWAATHGASNVMVFEPADYGECEGTNDPNLDEDFDGYDNADEILNGTSPCNGGDKPADVDGDLESDLLDNDDDNDGVLDVDDAFQIDPNNGLTTNLPLNLPFQNNDPGTGFFGIGLTGLMTNGTTDYLDMFDPENMTVGGAGGKFTIDAFTDGDAHQAVNDQDYAFQVGVNVDNNSNPFTVHTQLESDYFVLTDTGTGTTPENYESYGMYIGTGDQDNYLKIVLRGNNSGVGFQVLLENGGATSQNNYNVANILIEGSLDLFFQVDPSAGSNGTAQPAYSLDGGATLVSLGSPINLPAGWLDPNDDQGLAVGLISTSTGGTDREVGGSWAFLTVLESGPAVDKPLTDVEVLVNSDPLAIELNNVFVDDGGLGNLDFSVSNVQNPSLFDPQPNISQSGDTISLNLSFAIDAVGTSEITITATDENGAGESASDTFLVTVLDEAPILYRLNTGGPTIATIDDGPDWITDVSGQGATYLVEGGDNTFGPSGGSVYTGPVIMTDPSLPSGVPSDIFEIERWDPTAAPEMTYAFPATAGSQATVRLYFAELFTGVTGAGQRVFDVSVEGSVPSAFNNVDAFATAGAKGAIMVETTVTVGPDGDIDLVFIHDVENPAIKGIEILGVTDGNVDNPPVVNAFGTQTNNEGDTPDLYVEATDDGASMTFGATGLPTGLDMEITNGHIFGTIADGAAGNSPYNVTISVDDGVNSPVEFNFVWNVLDPNISGAILYRVNNGGPEVAALDGGPVWSEDQVPEGGTTGGSAVTGTPSPYVNSPDTNNAYATDATVTLADSVPAGIPASLFQTERWDPLAAPEMQWAFPVVSGTTVEVRLYFAEVFATTAVVGGRVFDVSVEGTVPAIFTDLEPYSLAGNQQDVGSMVSYITEITDGVLNLEFIHGTENPAVKAIEIIDVTPTGGNEAPTVLNAIPDITILENETISDINLLAPQVFEDDVDGAPYMLYDASSDNIALVDVSVDTTTLSFTVGNGTGTANITVTAEDSEGLIGTDTFLVTVEVDDTDNPPVVEVEILDVTVDENAAPVIVDLAAAFEDDVTLDADLDYSVMSNSNLPLVGTGISGTELTLTFSADMFGTADIEVKAEDELGQSITDTFTVTVNEVPDNFAPVADNGGIPDETAEENDGPITIALGDYFSDVEDADVDLTFNVVGNTNLPLVSTNIVAGDLTLTLATDMFGTANISVTATDTEGATSTPDLFVLTVNEYDPQDIVLYRVNNGGPVITDTPIDWSEDQAATAGNANGPANPGTPSPYLVNVASGDTTFAPDTFTINNDNTTAPPTLFATERYSAVANPNNMQWEFPATQSGWYQVNLYFAENWTGAQTAGVRVFDVQIEGNTVLDNYDVFVAAGAINTAVVESIYVEITDGTLDLDFIKTPANNPSIKGIEVILLGAPPANMPPTVDAPLEDVEVFVNSADTIINLDDYFSDPEALALSYGANVVSSSPAGLVNASITDSTLTLSYTTDTSGVAVVTITATDSEAQSVSDTFSVTVIEPDPVDNTAPIVVNPIDEVTVNENSADTVIDISTVFFDAQQPANTLNVSAVSNNGALVGATVSGTDLTLIYTPDSFGVAAITVTAEDNQGETVDTVFAVVVNEVDDRQVFFRVNTGGPELPAADGSLPVWSVDNNTTPSPYRVAGSTNISTGTDPINMSDPSVAGGPAPAALFQTERWDNANGAEMKWEFPVDNGTEVEVRLYFAEIYNQVSLRVFDVSVEGNIPPQLDDINPTAIAGADGAFMRSVIVTSDGMIDIEFLHLGNDNPAIKGIEILEAPAGNTPPTVANPIPNVTVAQDSADELLDLSAVFTDLEDGSNLTLSVENNTNSALVTVDDSNIGTSGEISLSFAAGASGMSAITVRATDSGTLFAEDIFLVTVNAEQDLPEILYRVNAGGDLVASTDSGPDWSADTSGSPSPYVILGTCGNCNNTYGGGSGASAGNPTSAPTPVFQNERWDNTSAPTMQWEFPVANGDYIVNLYFVEAFATASGARVFDVNVEGALTLDDYDIFVAAGGTNIAVVESVPVTVIDGIVNIEFVHGVIENPKINAIEILEAPVNNTNTPPTVINPIDDISVEENGTIATIDVSNVFDDADLPTDTLTLSVLSTNDTLVDAVLNGTDLELTLGTDESGIAAISLKATDEAGASATDTFIVTVTPPDVVNTPPTVADAINDIVQPFGTTSDNIPLTDVFTDAEQDDATLTLGILGISNLTLFDNVTVNGSTLEITYATGVSGTSNITVRATDNGGLSATNTFAVTVQPDDTPDNNPPTVVSPILDVSHIVNEVTSEIIDLTDVFADVEDDDIPTPLNLVVLSNSNLGLVDASISGTDLTLTYTPNVVSSATLTVRAFDSNGGFVDDSFVVTINAPANTPPTVANPLTDPTEYELGAEDNIISLVGLFTDVEQDDATLALAVTDVGNAALITSANVLGSDLILTYGGIVGESTVTITATDNEAASTPFTFTVIVSSSDTNISVIKTAPQSVLVGDQFIYTIDVTNNGLAIAQDVKITDILPGGVEFVSFNPADPICSEVNGVVICNIAQIGAGETETIEITVEAVSASQFYQLSATNSAPFTVPNLTLTHTIPDSLTFVNVVPSDQCVFNENNNTITCSFGSTAPGVTKFATVEVTTNEPSIITNTAIVSADNADTVASNQAITTVEATDIVLDASALVEITPGGGLGASTFGGSSIQITNNSADGVNITGISIDFSTAILPDMVFDPVGAGGDATASCFTANVGGAAVGVVAPADPCVDPYTVPRNGGFDVMTLAFTDFGAGEYFAFTTDVDPNSIKDVPGAGNAGAVSGYELTGSTVTVTFSDGSSEQILVASIYEDGSLGGGQAVVANDALDAPTIALLGYPTTPVTVNDTAQTVQVTGTPGANVSLLLMDTRLYIATGAPPFGVTDTTYYANEAMSGKTLYTGVIPAGGTLNVPVTLLQTASGDATPDGGLNRIVAVLSDAPYAADTLVSQTSNFLVVKYDPDLVSPGIVFDPATITVNVVAGESTTIDITADSSDASTLPSPVAILDFDDATNLDADWLSTTSAMTQGVSYELTIDATSLVAGTTLTGRLEGTVAGYEIGILPITLNVVETAGDGVATVSITPGGGLGSTVYGGTDKLQISNNSPAGSGVQITSISIDLGTGILPDMVWDPIGTGGDATAQCFTASGAATTVGLVTPADPCVTPFSVPRQGGFDVITLNFTGFDPGENFSFSTDIDPNSIQGVPGAGNAGAVSGYELIGSTVTVSFSDGSVVTTSLFEDGSLGGGSAVAAANAPATPGIAVLGVSPTPAIVNTLNQTVIVTGTPGASVSLLQMDARLYIASGNPAFNVSDTTFYANEAMSGKTVYTGTIGLDGTLSIPVTLLQTAGATGTPDGGLNHFIAVIESGVGEQTSQTSNTVILKYDPDYTGPALVITPETLAFAVQADIITGDSFVVSTSDSSVVTGVALTAEDATLSAPAWLTIPATTDTGVAQNLTVDTTGLSDGLYTATVTASAAGYLPVNMQVSVTVGTVSSQAICINAGGPAYTTVADSFFPAGVEFLADSTNVSPYFDSGSKSTFTNPSIVLTNSNNPPLFTTERSATANLVPFNFALDVNPGQYLVQMYFADIYFGATGGGGRDPNDGQRVFDLTVEPGTANEVLLLDDYDLNADVGPETVVLHQGIFTVSDSQLNINFTPSVDQAKISALCVTPVTGGGNIAPTINPIADATVSEGEIFATTVSAFDSEIVSLSATVEDALAAPVSATIVDNGNNTASISIPTVVGDAGDVYTVTVSADDGVNPVATETFLVYVIPVSENEPSAEILITDGVTDNLQSWNDTSTYGGDSFTIQNTGDVNITSVAFNVSTTYMPDIVFDPVAHGGDTVAKCFDANTGAATVGLVTADGACGVPPFGLPNLDQQAGDTDPDAGYFGLTITFDDFNPTELFGFSVDMDPSSIKGDTTPGGSGGISGMELIGSTVTVTFEDGTIITAPVWLDGVQSNAGGRVVIGQFAPVAPSISMVGLTTPTTTNVLSQMVQVLGTPNAPFTLLQVDGRLHIDSGSANGDYPNGYDIDPYEANESIGKSVYTGTLNGSGVAMVPLNLLLTTQTYGGPDGGINHFIAVINGLNGQTSGTSNVLVVEYDPNFNGGNNTPPVVTNPGTQTSQSGVPITPLQIVATAPEIDQTLAFSATGLPQGLSINPGTGVISGTPTCAVVGGAGAFQESQSGLFSIEVESVPPTDDWTIETAVNGASGDYYEWQNGSTFTGIVQPGQGVLSYPVEIETPGRYRFLWRTAAPNSTEHNDTWVRVTGAGSDAVGVQGSTEIQIGNGQGWIKVYQNSSGNNWAWVANTVDNDAHQIYFDFATAGVYTVEFSARSTLHKLDRWVLYNSSYSQGQATSLNVPISQREQQGGSDNCTYDVEITVIDNGTPIGVTITEFQWNVTTDVVVENVAPTANVGSYANPILDTDTLVGETVILDGSGSSDSDGTIVTYNWTVNGSPVNQNTDTPTVNLNDGANTVSLIVIDDDGASSAPSATTINIQAYVPPGECGGLVVEAESGELSGNFVIGNDANASGGQYVHAPQLSGNSSVPSNNHHVTLCFTVPQVGTYQMIGWVWASDDGGDSFFVNVGGQSYIWDVLINTTYAQNYVNGRGVGNPLQVNLPAGEVEITFAVREDGARLDKVQLELVGGQPTNLLPTADAGSYGTVADSNGLPGEPFVLDGTDSNDPDGNIVTYIWAINGIAVGQNTPTPAVNLSDGSNQVSLIVVDNDGASSAPSITAVNVTAPVITPPTCGPLTQQAENGTLAGNFTTAASGSASGGQYILTPNGSGSSNGAPSATTTATYCFTVAQTGTYQITGQVSGKSQGNTFWIQVLGNNYLWDMPITTGFVQDFVNNRGGADPVQLNLTAGQQLTVVVTVREDGAWLDTIGLELVGGQPTNIAPTANVGVYGTIADNNGIAGETVTLDGSGSDDPDGTIATYNWTVNGTPLNQNTDTPSVNLNDGANTVSLIVIDDDGASSTASSTTINVSAPTPQNQAPIANVGSYITVADSNGVAGETVTLDGSGSDDPDGTINTYNWTVNGSPVNQNTDTPSVSLNDGANSVSLIVIDDEGASSTPSTTTITVEAPVITPPTCGTLTQQAENGTLTGNFTTAASGSASGGQYILTPNGSGDSMGSPSGSTTATYCFTVAQTGTYQITAQVSGKSQGNTFWVQVLGSNYLWDMPLTAGFVQDYVNNRSGSDPIQLNLTAGQQLTVVVTVREDGSWLDTIGLELVGGQPTNLPPTANAGSYGTVAESDNAPGETIELDGTASNDPDGNIVTYNWTVNSVAVGQNTATPSVTLNDGANTVSLIVIDDDSTSSAPANVTINVEPYVPTGGTCGGLVVEAEDGELSGTFVIGNDANTSGGQYVHAPQLSGNASVPTNNNNVTLCFTVPQAGTYQMIGWIWANDSGSDSFFVNVGGESYIWDGMMNTNYDPDYVNGRGVGNPLQVNLPAGEVEIVFALREDGARLDKVQLELVGGQPTNIAPTANAGSYGTVTDNNGQPGETILLNGTASNDPDGNIVTYNWTVNGTPLGQNTPNPSVNLTDGANTVSLIVIDDDGASSTTSSTTINVTAPTPQNQTPTANVGMYATIEDTNGVAGETVTLAGSGSNDPDGTIATYNWTVNGSPVNQNTPTPSVNLNDGANSVSLIVIDDDGASSAPSATTINVTAPAQSGSALSSFSLINANTDSAIGPLANNAVLNISTLPAAINVRANTTPATVGSVVFSMTGAVNQTQTENGAPYALFSDNSGNYFDWTPVAGSYTLTATPYSGSNGSGTAGTPLTINFTIQAGGVVTPPPTGNLITNIQVANGKTYQQDTLAVGENIYIDRNYTFTSVPAALNGDEFIRTANDDKTVSNPNFLTFTLTANATVYVAWDSRYPAPSWLSSWTLTGLNLVGQDFNNTTLSRVVYSQSFPAGQVTLPASGFSSAGTSYIVSAEPQGVSAQSVTIPGSDTREVPPVENTTIPVAPVENNGIIVIPPPSGAPQTNEQGIIVIPSPNGG